MVYKTNNTQPRAQVDGNSMTMYVAIALETMGHPLKVSALNQRQGRVSSKELEYSHLMNILLYIRTMTSTTSLYSSFSTSFSTSFRAYYYLNNTFKEIAKAYLKEEK